MTETTPDLWPADFGEPPVLTPVSILRQQGAALGQKTQNIVIGRVATEAHEQGNSQGFRHKFILQCLPLGYSTPLLFVDHDVNMYPVVIRAFPEPVDTRSASNPQEFEQKLKEIFALDKIKRIIGSLLAQSKQ